MDAENNGEQGADADDAREAEQCAKAISPALAAVIPRVVVTPVGPLVGAASVVTAVVVPCGTKVRDAHIRRTPCLRYQRYRMAF